MGFGTALPHLAQDGSPASLKEPTFLCSLQGFPLHDDMETCGRKAPGGSAWTAMGLGCSLLTGLLSGVVAWETPSPLPAYWSTPASPLPSEAGQPCWWAPLKRPSEGPGARHERPVSERTLLPLLLPTVPWPHCCQARLSASRAYLLTAA